VCHGKYNSFEFLGEALYKCSYTIIRPMHLFDDKGVIE